MSEKSSAPPTTAIAAARVNAQTAVLRRKLWSARLMPCFAPGPASPPTTNASTLRAYRTAPRGKYAWKLVVASHASDCVDRAPDVELPLPTDAAPAPAAEAVSSTDARADGRVLGDRLGVPEGSNRHVWEPTVPRPSFFFLVVVSIVTFVLDIATKSWAKGNFEVRSGGHIEEIIGNGNAPGLHMNLDVVDNMGGAWGLFSNTSEMVRRPFFLLVSVAAIAFILTLYRRLLPRQRALKWGLPLVLGGALGNVYDRIRWGQVVDFLEFFFVNDSPNPQTPHRWPTFNVADIAICVGVGLMAIDMFTTRRKHAAVFSPPRPPAQAGEIAATFLGLPTNPPLLGTRKAEEKKPLRSRTRARARACSRARARARGRARTADPGRVGLGLGLGLGMRGEETAT